MKGNLFLVGIGPGDERELTFHARDVLEQCEAVVGYHSYFNSLPNLLNGKKLFPFKMGEEVKRALFAVNLARNGKKVALISSGDPGIYGMASLALEILEPHEIEKVEVVPGISALNAAASLLGAPLANDFVVVSLSNLLTPWELIEKRLLAACLGDFVVVIYNPCSEKRKNQLIQAQETFLEHRSPETPVGIVRKKVLADDPLKTVQDVKITTLREMLNFPIDMLTTIILGNSYSFIKENKIITVRGYRL